MCVQQYSYCDCGLHRDVGADLSSEFIPDRTEWLQADKVERCPFRHTNVTSPDHLQSVHTCKYICMKRLRNIFREL